MKVKNLKTRIAAFGLAVLMGVSTLSSANAFAAEQTDDDLAVRKGGVVVGDFAQAGGHGQATGICQRVDFSVLRYNTRPG